MRGPGHTYLKLGSWRVDRNTWAFKEFWPPLETISVTRNWSQQVLSHLAEKARVGDAMSTWLRAESSKQGCPEELAALHVQWNLQKKSLQGLSTGRGQGQPVTHGRVEAELSALSDTVTADTGQDRGHSPCSSLCPSPGTHCSFQP